jgi:hypothetical protein
MLGALAGVGGAGRGAVTEGWKVALTGLLLVHSAFVVLLIGAGPLLRGDVLVQDDYSLHFANALTARELLWQSGRPWGYDPFLMAGYPAGTLESLSNRAAELVVALLRPVEAAQVFALFLVLVYLTPPLCTYQASRWMGLSPGAAVGAAGLAALLFYRFLSEPRAYISYGMYAHAAMFPLALLAAAGFVQLATRPSFRRAALAGVALGLGLLLHVNFALAALPSVVGVALGCRSWRGAGFIAGSVGLALVMNLFWIVPVFAARSSIGQPPFQFFPATGPELLSDLLTDRGSTLSYMVVLVGAWSLPSFARARQGFAAAACTVGTCILFVIGGFGSLLPFVRDLQPGRFLDGMAFFMLPPAIDGIARWSGADRRRQTLALAAAFFLGLPAAGNVPTVVLGRDEAPRLTYVPVEVQQLIALLRDVTTPEARVMLEEEDHWRRRHRYGYTHLPALFPRLVGREFIGGPYEDARYLQHFASFGDGRAFGRRSLAEFSDAELGDFLQLYNAGWVVAWSDAAKTDLSARPFARRVAAVGPYAVFEIGGARSFVVGQIGARVRASLDRIDVVGALPGVTVLKYHWSESLRTQPALPVGRVAALDDPIGFIGVTNGSVTDFAVVYAP